MWWTAVPLVGDFNYNDINWGSSTVYASSSDTHSSEEFLEVLSTFSLYQHVFKPTLYKSGVLPSLLELVITNEEGMVSNLTYLPPLGRFIFTF